MNSKKQNTVGHRKNRGHRKKQECVPAAYLAADFCCTCLSMYLSYFFFSLAQLLISLLIFVAFTYLFIYLSMYFIFTFIYLPDC